MEASHDPAAAIACPLCGRPEARVGYRIEAAAIASSEARRDLAIAVCEACGYVFQSTGTGEDYEEFIRHAYETWDDHALFGFPRRSVDNVAAADIVARHSQAGARVLEIGSNLGDILALVKERLPGASILGVDPAAHENLAVPTVRAFFSPRLFSSRFDTVILKQVLEHFADPRPMLDGVREVLEDGGTLYIDVPNLERILRDRPDAFLLEHTAYYTLETLSAALVGYEVLEVQKAGSLRLAARKLPGPGGVRPPADGRLAAQVAREGLARLARGRQAGAALIAAHAAAGGRVVFFGAYSCFRALYRELSPLLGGCPRAVLDDAMQGAREPVFGLARIETPGPGDLLLLCSNNAEVLERMWARAREMGGGAGDVAVLRPWSTFLHADGTTSDLGA